MDWVKLSARFYMDPAVASLPDADSELGFVRSLAYAGNQETGGFIPASIVPSLFRRRRYEASVRALVNCCLWIPVCGDYDQLEGWRIARWEEWQQELEALARRRSADRDRKRRERGEKKTQVNGMSRDMSAGLSRDCPERIERETRSSPTENNPPVVPPSGPVTPDRFDEFWEVYPRKQAKKAAQKAWARALREVDADTIIDAARRYATARRGQDPQYTAMPTTWLNQGRWDDEPPSPHHPQQPALSTRDQRVADVQTLKNQLAGGDSPHLRAISGGQP